MARMEFLVTVEQLALAWGSSEIAEEIAIALENRRNEIKSVGGTPMMEMVSIGYVTPTLSVEEDDSRT